MRRACLHYYNLDFRGTALLNTITCAESAEQADLECTVCWCAVPSSQRWPALACHFSAALRSLHNVLLVCISACTRAKLFEKKHH
jgi:hypothetical protein